MFKTLLPNPRSWRFICVSSERATVLGLTVWLTSVLRSFYIWCAGTVQFHSMMADLQLSTLVCWKDSFFFFITELSQYLFWKPVGHRVGVYFWALSSIDLLVGLSRPVFLLCFVVSSEVRKCPDHVLQWRLPSFFFKIFTPWGSLQFHLISFVFFFFFFRIIDKYKNWKM